eukprot:COSAG04_NODE_404_length_14877_cov_7.858371_9_plen_170_part_00
MARRTFGVDYPNLYAYAGGEHVYNHKKGAGESLTPGLGQQAADDYNAVQRAHQNTVENQPLFLALLLFGSLGFPAIAAGLGLLWLLARVAYSAGYYRAPPPPPALPPPPPPPKPTPTPLSLPLLPGARPECSDARVQGGIVGFLTMFALFGLNIAFVVYLLIEKEPIPW